MREGAGPDVDILLDLNFNARPEGYLKLLRAFADFDFFWIELDTHNPKAQGYIRDHSPHPIASCETLIGLKAFLPFFEHQAMDVAIVDTIWNGVWQSMRIAALADAHDVNVAPHNFYGDLCSLMNVHFAAAVPNLHIMEIDVEDVPWRSDVVREGFEVEQQGRIVRPNQRPGLGIEIDENEVAKHPFEQEELQRVFYPDGSVGDW